MSAAARTGVIWHDVENASYAADLPLWEELADEGGGPVLEIGCGTGRVALHLAARGHRVVGVEIDQALAQEAARRAAEGGLPLRVVEADGREISLEERFALALIPMQTIQLLRGCGERAAMLAACARHLARGGRLAVAIVDGVPADAVGEGADLLPDVREIDGWVYSSLPVEVSACGDALTVRRRRQLVGPAGELTEELDVTTLALLRPADVEAEAAPAGLRPAGRREVGSTDAHVGSTAVLLEAGEVVP